MMRTTLYYILTLLTGGQFVFVWAYLMVRDANRLDATFLPRWRLLAGATVLLYATYIVLLMVNLYRFATWDINNGIPVVVGLPVLAAGALLLFAVLGFLLLKVAAFLRTAGEQLPGALALVLLTFLYFVSFPLVQTKLIGKQQRFA